MPLVVNAEQAAFLAGRDLGHTEWLEVTQERVALFADATDDHQWIHVDPERATSGPFGGSVAHGFLSLSLIARFWSELLTVEGAEAVINYGLEKVRFPSPVRVGARIRMHARVAEVVEVARGLQLVVDQTIEVEGAAKPAVVARSLNRIVVSQ